MLTQLRRSAQILLIPLLIGSIGCQNHNLFSKLHGDSSDPATLNAEAAIALRDKDFSKALDLSKRVLANDPNDADALYYSASAQMGLTGINLGALVSNVLDQVNGAGIASFSGLPGAVALTHSGVAAQSGCGGADSLLSGINCDAFNSAIDPVLVDLRLIASGVAHGDISRNDVPMLIDYGILSALRAAIRAVIGGYLDFTNSGGNFHVAVGANVNNLCTTDATTAIAIVRDVASSYSVFYRVVTLLSLKDSSIVAKLQDDIKDAGDEIFTDDGSVLPHACFQNVFNAYNPPLTKANYLSVFQSAAFTPPS